MEMRVVREALSLGDMGDEGNTLITDSGRFLTGLLGTVTTYIESTHPHIDIEVVDKRKVTPGVPYEELDTDAIPNILPGITLRDYQVSSIKKFLLHGRGTAVIATGGGKTEIGIGSLKYLQDSGLVDRTLFVAGSTPIFEQTADRYHKRGLSCGMLGGKKHRDLDSDNTVAMIQTLWSGIKRHDPDILKVFNESDAVIFDECHHLRSKSWINVASKCKAPWRYGLTMQMFDEIGEHGKNELRLIGATGSVLVDLPYWVLRDKGWLASAYVQSVRSECLEPINSYKWKTVYHRGIVENRHRNVMLANLTHYLRVTLGRKPLLFVWRHTHGEIFLDMLRGNGYDVLFYMGNGKAHEVTKDGKDNFYEEYSYKQLKHYVEDDRGVVIGSDVMTQGVDVPDIDALLIAVGMKKHRQLMQRIGRGVRPAKDDVLVFDPEDNFHPFLNKHAVLRREVYDYERIPIYDGNAFLPLAMENPIAYA